MNRFVALAIVGQLAATGLVAAAVLTRTSTPAPPPTNSTAEAPAPAPVDDGVAATTGRVDDISAELADDDGNTHEVFLSLEIEMGSPEELAQLEDDGPLIRDAVVRTLAGEPVDALSADDGVVDLKEQLRAAIDDVVPGEVVAVYLTQLDVR